MPVNILIVDDHERVRIGLRRHLENEADFVVIGEADNGRDGVAKAEELRPDIVIMDLNMPGMDGLQATEILRERMPQAKVLIFSLHLSNALRISALKSGARGCVMKTGTEVEMVSAIRTIMRGECYLGRGE